MWTVLIVEDWEYVGDKGKLQDPYVLGQKWQHQDHVKVLWLRYFVVLVRVRLFIRDFWALSFRFLILYLLIGFRSFVYFFDIQFFDIVFVCAHFNVFEVILHFHLLLIFWTISLWSLNLHHLNLFLILIFRRFGLKICATSVYV